MNWEVTSWELVHKSVVRGKEVSQVKLASHQRNLKGMMVVDCNVHVIDVGSREGQDWSNEGE